MAGALARLGDRYGLIYLGHTGCGGCRIFGPLLRAFAQALRPRRAGGVADRRAARRLARGGARHQRHGLIFGARLAAATTRLEITDMVFARNIRNYARQCVFHALLLGHISADDLRESTDIWSLVTAGGTPSAGASPARMFEFATRQAAVGTGATPIAREIVTCQTGAARLNALWNAEIARAGTIFGRRIFPGSRTEAAGRAPSCSRHCPPRTTS